MYREKLNSLSDSDPEYPFWQQTWFILLLFVMALSFFGLATFLFLSLDSEYGFNSPAYAAVSEGVEVSVVITFIVLLIDFD